MDPAGVGAGGAWEALVWGGISQSLLPFRQRDAWSSSKLTLQAVHLPPPWDANLEVRQAGAGRLCVSCCVSERRGGWGGEEGRGREKERENCLILGDSKVPFPLPTLKKKLGCAHFTNFKRKEMGISVKDMTNGYLPNCPRTGVFCYVVGWHSGLEIPNTTNTRDHIAIC